MIDVSWSGCQPSSENPIITLHDPRPTSQLCGLSFVRHADYKAQQSFTLLMPNML